MILLLLLGSFLYERGWTFERIGLRPTWRDTFIGIILAATSYEMYRVGWFAFFELFPALARAALVHHSVSSLLSPFSVLALTAVNPLFEEVFVAGYVITVLREKYGPVPAVSASFTIRILYHLYQGVGGLFSHVPVGLLFGIWYVRTRRLWPLIVAHAALAVFALCHYIDMGNV